MNKEDIKALMVQEQIERAESQLNKSEQRRKKIYWPPYIFGGLFIAGVIGLVIMFNYESPEVRAIKADTKRIEERTKQKQAETQRMQSGINYSEEVLDEYDKSQEEQ
ncbi:hypothetical protein KDC22_14520 [Paenibacillus tritici]|uniref:hypothetical protein n=1 Tax=Paenibacillus tritici TaxID=1873425 RepID=UPI001BAA8004|nr:hypothetical protein [Paenibacillus tritici]QUL57581.1 hypothetical protein KDC22_14520 [Paenibacillus tritici]